MTGTLIDGDQFVELVTSVTRERVHFECQRTYDIPEEAGDLDDWVDAIAHRRQPRTPPEIGWWAGYLADAREMRGRGVRLTRIRVVDEPMTDYQQWGAWAAPWYAAAGEQLYYLTRAEAHRAGLPDRYDWDLLDGDRVITTRFTAAGQVTESRLVTGPAAAMYATWRDIAVAYGTAAAPAAA